MATNPKTESADEVLPQDQAVLEDTDHVQYHLDVDPNDPRNRPATPRLPSLDDEDQQ